MRKAVKVVRIGGKKAFVLSATLPGKGESPLWYIYDGEGRHYNIIGINIIRYPDSLHLSVTLVFLLLTITWPASHKDIKK